MFDSDIANDRKGFDPRYRGTRGLRRRSSANSAGELMYRSSLAYTIQPSEEVEATLAKVVAERAVGAKHAKSGG